MMTVRVPLNRERRLPSGRWPYLEPSLLLRGPMFLVKRVKKFPIFDLFLKNEKGWAGWTRLVLTKEEANYLGGRQLSPSELSLAKEQIKHASH